MPDNFSALSPAEAKSFLVDYRAGIPARFADFLEALRAGGGPVDDVAALDPSSLIAGWSWFVDTYGQEEPLTPIGNAGLEYGGPVLVDTDRGVRGRR